MPVSKLSLYQGALRQLAERKLSSISEAREARYLLDDAWDDGAVNSCLQMGQWKHAMRSSLLDSSPSIEPDFGLRYAFAHPDDFVRTAAVCGDEFFDCPLTRFADEGGYWFADQDPIYVKYVSNGASYGGDYSLWPDNFKTLVETFLASKIVASLTNGETKEEKIKLALKVALSAALSTDAQAGPPVFQPRGSWVMARGGRYARSGRGPDR